MKMFFSKKIKNAPIVMITKSSDVKEYSCIEEAIKELEADPDTPKEKIEKLRKGVDAIKNKGTIKIQNGEIIN